MKRILFSLLTFFFFPEIFFLAIKLHPENFQTDLSDIELLASDHLEILQFPFFNMTSLPPGPSCQRRKPWELRRPRPLRAHRKWILFLQPPGSAAEVIFFFFFIHIKSDGREKKREEKMEEVSLPFSLSAQLPKHFCSTCKRQPSSVSQIYIVLHYPAEYCSLELEQ